MSDKQAEGETRISEAAIDIDDRLCRAIRASAKKYHRFIVRFYPFVDVDDLVQEIYVYLLRNKGLRGASQQLLAYEARKALSGSLLLRKSRRRSHLERGAKALPREEAFSTLSNEDGNLTVFDFAATPAKTSTTCEVLDALNAVANDLPERLKSFLREYVSCGCDMQETEQRLGLKRKVGNSYMSIIRNTVRPLLGKRQPIHETKHISKLEIHQAIADSGGEASMGEIISALRQRGCYIHPNRKTAQNRINAMIQKHRREFSRSGVRWNGKWKSALKERR